MTNRVAMEKCANERVEVLKSMAYRIYEDHQKTSMAMFLITRGYRKL